jgi:hypothetical protein
MAARTTHYVHADGTVSTRTSRTRVYGWAVEETRDLHVEAAAKGAYVVKLEAELESFERAVAADKVVRKSKPWGRGERYQDFYVEDPASGERHWIGSQIVDADGDVRGEAVDVKEAVREQWRSEYERIERVRAEGAELASGPRHAYAIVRWSERADSAAKAVSSFGYTVGATYRVVEAVEGRPAPVQPAPAAEEQPAEEQQQEACGTSEQHRAAGHAVSRGGMAVRLSVARLRELLDRAATGNYMIIQAEDGTWVELHPYVEDEA